MSDLLLDDEVEFFSDLAAVIIAHERTKPQFRGRRQRVSCLPLDDPRRQTFARFVVTDA